jgi:DNA-binding NarL/FixJ family response regulator
MTTTSISILKIAIVEDSSIIVDRMKGMLFDISGVEFVGHADTLPATIELIKISRPDVVILDINLRSPDGKNGIDILSRIREVYPVIKVIMLTNLTDMRYRIMCKDLGADYFFDKSNDFDRIPDTLREIIYNRA